MTARFKKSANDNTHVDSIDPEKFPTPAVYAARENGRAGEDCGEAKEQPSNSISQNSDTSQVYTTTEVESLSLLRPFDQTAIAILWVACVLGAAWFLFDRNRTRGIIDIEKSVSLDAEFMVDINSANWPELMNLPGVGEKTARDIVEHRDSRGRFTSLDSLAEVSGIGESTIKQLAPFIVPFAGTGSSDARVPQPKQTDESRD